MAPSASELAGKERPYHDGQEVADSALRPMPPVLPAKRARSKIVLKNRGLWRFQKKKYWKLVQHRPLYLGIMTRDNDSCVKLGKKDSGCGYRKMSEHSQIQSTDATWNPVRGCTKISSGCAHCYAETFAERFRGVPDHPYEQGFDLKLVPEKLAEPLKWSDAKMVFVNSMSDLFHQDVSDSYIREVVRVMEIADWHTCQVLTKRSERLRDLLKTTLQEPAQQSNIWWGVSVENRKHGLPRIDHLREAPAKVRFLSIEPLLEDLGRVNFDGIHWIIVGGESGHGARPMEKKWVTSIRDQCLEAKVPFFFKQWGGVRKKKTGRELDGKTYDEMPIKSNIPVPCLHERRRIIEGIQVLHEVDSGPLTMK